MNIQVHMYVWVFMHVCVCVWGAEVDVSVFPHGLLADPKVTNLARFGDPTSAAQAL